MNNYSKNPKTFAVIDPAGDVVKDSLAPSPRRAREDFIRNHLKESKWVDIRKLGYDVRQVHIFISPELTEEEKEKFYVVRVGADGMKMLVADETALPTLLRAFAVTGAPVAARTLEHPIILEINDTVLVTQTSYQSCGIKARVTAVEVPHNGVQQICVCPLDPHEREAFGGALWMFLTDVEKV